jgi:phenylalanyl-tRNA synthetase alpha chain
MKDKINKIREEIGLFKTNSIEELENFRIKYTSRKGVLSNLFDDFKKVINSDKKEIGLLINSLKNEIEEKINIHQNLYSDIIKVKQKVKDKSLVKENINIGARHPLFIIQNDIIDIFSKLGFVYTEGPEIEDDWHNFSGLNFPKNHPARDMQDTFFIREDYALRTHTSSVQIRLMEKQPLPIRAIMPGRVYRNEVISARSHCFFHQIEGIYIDKKVSFSDLKQTLYFFIKELFGKDFEIRFRPSYFPFTELSAEMDISCIICKGDGCNVCKYTGWVEILGCGMIDPNVLKLNNIDPELYNGFAFGVGLERITMLINNIKDLRVFSNNNKRFIEQFSK